MSVALSELMEQRFALVNVVPLYLHQSLLIYKNFFKLIFTVDKLHFEKNKKLVIDIYSHSENELKTVFLGDFFKNCRHSRNLYKFDEINLRYSYERDDDFKDFLYDLIDFLAINHFLSEYFFVVLNPNYFNKYNIKRQDLSIVFEDASISTAQNARFSNQPNGAMMITPGQPGIANVANPPAVNQGMVNRKDSFIVRLHIKNEAGNPFPLTLAFIFLVYPQTNPRPLIYPSK